MSDHRDEHANGASDASEDCGCGCGGTGDCGDAGEAAEPTRERSLFTVRRKLLVGAIGFSGFAATLASRRAMASGVNPCANLTGLIVSPNPSANCNQQPKGGLTPGFWANHGNCWPAELHPDTSFAAYGLVAFPFSGETLRKALCPPNGDDNLAFQVAAALCNAGCPAINIAYGYPSVQAFVTAFNNAAAASEGNWDLIHTVLAGLNVDNPANPAFCPGSGTKLCK
jgi:hypothetical protein